MSAFVFLSLDFRSGSERESLLIGILDSEEGEPAQKFRDQPGAEERRVHQTGQPAQEGSLKSQQEVIYHRNQNIYFDLVLERKLDQNCQPDQIY